MNFSLRGLPTEIIETILTLEMPCKPHSKHKNGLKIYMTSSIRHQLFEFSQGDGPDFSLSNFKKKFIHVLSLLGSFKSNVYTKYSKILTRPIKAAINNLRGLLTRWDFPKGLLGMHGSRSSEGLLKGNFRPKSTIKEVFWAVKIFQAYK